jgi:hypothetical protein
MPSRRPTHSIDSMPVEAFLDGFSPAHRAIAERLRQIVLDAVPDATERVRVGWRLIGFDLPVGRRSVFFAWVFPEKEHVHLGFPAGVVIDDPAGVMRGAGITKRARWLTWQTGDPIDAELATELVLAAAAVARLPRGALR